MPHPIIVTATFGDGDNGWIQQLRRDHYPSALNRVPAHLTMFHQLPPSVEAELSRRIARLVAGPAPRAEISGVIDLGGGTALAVQSEALEDFRFELAEAMHGLLTPQDQSPWRPHITVQNKVESREARKLQQSLRGRYEGRAIAIKALAAWRYLDGPWEPIRDWRFRG